MVECNQEQTTTNLALPTDLKVEDSSVEMSEKSFESQQSFMLRIKRQARIHLPYNFTVAIYLLELIQLPKS